MDKKTFYGLYKPVKGKLEKLSMIQSVDLENNCVYEYDWSPTKPGHKQTVHRVETKFIKLNIKDWFDIYSISNRPGFVIFMGKDTQDWGDELSYSRSVYFECDKGDTLPTIKDAQFYWESYKGYWDIKKGKIYQRDKQTFEWISNYQPPQPQKVEALITTLPRLLKKK